METFGEIYQEFKPTDIDRKGRVFGYIFAVRDVLVNGVKVGVASWVQRGIQTRHVFDEFGTRNGAVVRVADVQAARAIAKAAISGRIAINRPAWERNGHRVIG